MWELRVILSFLKTYILLIINILLIICVYRYCIKFKHYDRHHSLIFSFNGTFASVKVGKASM